MSQKTILLHCCCGPCATSCIETLLKTSYSVELLFSNSNIDTNEEFNIRLAALQTVANFSKVRLHIDTYKHHDWLQHVAGLENQPEKSRRCLKCFDWALQRTKLYAKKLNIMHFATSLTVSPHKRSKDIFSIGKTYDGFEPLDFKKHDGFARSLRLTKKLKLYRQKYCGCEFAKSHLIHKNS